MESIHQRIKRLREDKKISQQELADRVAKATGAKSLSYQSVQDWERDTAPSRKRLPAVADILGVTVTELVTGEPGAAYLAPKEEIVVELFRGLFPMQQKKLIENLRAHFDANQVIRSKMGQTQLKGVTDKKVRDAFKDTPPPSRKPSKKLPEPGRDLGNAMDDFL